MTTKPATLEDYLEYLDRMPKLYRIENKPVPLLRRLLRWLRSIW